MDVLGFSAGGRGTSTGGLRNKLLHAHALRPCGRTDSASKSILQGEYVTFPVHPHAGVKIPRQRAFYIASDPSNVVSVTPSVWGSDTRDNLRDGDDEAVPGGRWTAAPHATEGAHSGARARPRPRPRAPLHLRVVSSLDISPTTCGDGALLLQQNLDVGNVRARTEVTRKRLEYGMTKACRMATAF